ncbi:permease of the major facilitator superfamily [Fusarium bulbicola]|nr:permease of the major facilitator superfamily [Fusarium bulbicola]
MTPKPSSRPQSPQHYESDEAPLLSRSPSPHSPPPPKPPVSWSSLPNKGQLAVILLARLAEPLSERSLASYLFFQLQWFNPDIDPSEIPKQMGYITATFAAAQHKTRAFLLLPMCFNVGVIIGPLLTGFMADPVHTLPGIFGPGSVFGGEKGVQWLEKFPYALPNLFCFSVLMSAFFLVILGLDETHSQLRHSPDPGRRLEKLLLRIILRRKKNEHFYSSINTEDPSEELMDHDADQESGQSSRPTKAYSKTRPPFRDVLTKNVCLNMLQRFLQSLHVSAFNSILFSLLPTPKSDSADFHLPFRFTGGLGLSSERMGLANTIIGTIGIPLQLFIYPRLIERLGVKASYSAFLPLSIIAYFLLPCLVLLPDNNALVWTCLSAVLSLQVLSRTFVNPATMMLVNDSAPSPNLLGTVHGLASSISSAARIMGPTVGGTLLGWGLAHNLVGLPLWVLTILALANWVILWWIEDVNMSE